MIAARRLRRVRATGRRLAVALPAAVDVSALAGHGGPLRVGRDDHARAAQSEPAWACEAVLVGLAPWTGPDRLAWVWPLAGPFGAVLLAVMAALSLR